jgi:hypothetical protein
MLRVDGAGSRLHIRVYRGGRLAHLGHNHLVAAGELQGHALMTPEGPGSRFVLCIPVQSLQVDDAELRAAAGPEFSDPVPAAAAEATRDNMLGPSQLNGSRYPHIVVTGRVGDGAYPKFRVELQLAVRDKVHAVAATVGLEPFQGGLDAAGRLRVRLTDLGIEPYTALFGALAVKDELRIDYRVRALD